MSVDVQSFLEVAIRPQDQRPHLGFRIAGWRPPNQNDRLRGGKLRNLLRRRKQEKATAHVLVLAAAGRNAAREIWKPPQRYGVSMLEWGEPGRDLDGVVSAVKYVLDGLVKDGWLPSDKRDHFRHLEADHPDERPPWCPGARDHAVALVVWPMDRTEPLA